MPAIVADPERLDRDLLRLMGVLVVGAAVALLDTTIVSVAIEDLTRAFSTTVATAQWATTGYLLGMAAAIPMMGWLTDRWGPRRVWLGTLWLFLLGSVSCASAWSIESLIVFRVMQGVGGGLILPLVHAVLVSAAGPRRLGRVMGLVGIPGQLAPILGPILGGVVLGSFGWRWIFLVNLPLCLIALVLAFHHLHVPDHRTRVRLDLVGALLLIPSTVAILAGLSAAGEWATKPGRAVALLAGGTLLLCGFVLHARRLGHLALIDVRLLRHRSFALATVAMFLAGVCLYGPMLLLPLFYQQGRGVEVTEVGLLLAPQGIGMMAALWAAGRWTDQTGPRSVAVAGVLLAGGGTAVFVVASDTPLTVLSAALVSLGAGLGAIGVAVGATSYRDVEAAAVPRATSLLHVAQRIGASFGTVVIAFVLQRELSTTRPQASQAFVLEAFEDAFSWTLGFLVVVLLVVILLPAKPPTSPIPN